MNLVDLVDPCFLYMKHDNNNENLNFVIIGFKGLIQANSILWHFKIFPEVKQILVSDILLIAFP